MKNTFIFSKIILGTGLLLCTMNSCKTEPKKEEEIVVADAQNEENMDNEEIENDATFLADAAELHLTEIEIGKLALKKGVRPDVIKYAQMLIADHTIALEELKALSIKNTITLPTAMTEGGTEKYNKLNEKSGAEFDKDFVAMMAEEHEKAATEMTEISQKVKNPDVKLWTSRQVTMFTTHTDHAKKLK